MSANEDFLNKHTASTLEFAANNLANGVPREKLGFPENVTLTEDELRAHAQKLNDERSSRLAAISFDELVDLMRESARYEGYNEAADFGPSLSKHDSYDYAEELRRRNKAATA